MAEDALKQKAQEILSQADIKINGSRPWDIQVHNDKVYRRVFSQGTLGFGEAYMDGWWDSDQLDEMINKVLSLKLDGSFMSFNNALLYLKARIMNMQSRSRATDVTEGHYDLGNDFYQNMLDPYMQYTCGYWKNAKTLNQAQINKLDLVCKKLQLKPGDKVLELGCGWGGFAKYAAEKYKVSVTAYNISQEQVAFAREFTKGLPVKIIQADYRDATGTFDKVASIGLCEHVGYKNYRNLMEVAHNALKPNGLFLLHSIASNKSVKTCEPWYDKYIFPHGMLPSVAQLGTAMEGLFVMEDWHNFGPDYDKTLMAWNTNFNKNWPKFKDKYGERFYRMWSYYLLSMAGAFRARRNQLWQVVMSKGGVPGGYESVR